MERTGVKIVNVEQFSSRHKANNPILHLTDNCFCVCHAQEGVLSAKV